MTIIYRKLSVSMFVHSLAFYFYYIPLHTALGLIGSGLFKGHFLKKSSSMMSHTLSTTLLIYKD